MTHQVTHRAGRPRPAGFSVLRLGALAAVLLGAPAAMALDEQKGEVAAIKECDKRLCAILLEKNPKGPDLTCALTKTWDRSKIKEADNQQISWGFGDARCSVDLNLSRETLVTAMTADRITVRVPRHTANCVVEQDGKPEKVTAILAPKIEFRNGRAEKILGALEERGRPDLHRAHGAGRGAARRQPRPLPRPDDQGHQPLHRAPLPQGAGRRRHAFGGERQG